jgi:hypothetical protein
LSRVPDLQEIVDDLEAEIGRPISVEDRRWRLLAHSAQPDETDPVRQRSILTRETPPDVAAWLEGLGLHRARDFVDVPANEALGMTRRGCQPLRHGEVLLGFLWVIVGDRPLSDDERAALARGAGEAADNLWARDERRERTRSLLRAALAGEGAADLAAALRWPVTATYAVAVCAGGEEMAERLRRRRGAADFAWTSDPERVTIVARDPDGLPAALTAAGATGGVSASVDSLDRVPDALRQAEIAALCVRVNPAFAPVAQYGRLGSWGVVAELWSAADRPFPPLQILELASHRRGAQLLEALEGLLENGGDVADAARALHLHRASLYRRLARVEEITGFDLSRGDDRLHAHLGLRLYRLSKGGQTP